MSHPAFIPQPQNITAHWPALISRPTDGRRLTWPGWLVTNYDGMPARGWSRHTSQIVQRPEIRLTTIELQVRHPNH